MGECEGPIKFEYNQITPYIYIGTNLCCQGHFKKTLLRKGITSDISMEEDRLDAPFGVEYYLWLPTKNHYAPSSKQLLLGVSALHDLARKKIKCYVHCQRGHGRAPTLVAAYLVSKGMNLDKAIAFMKKKRPVVHPNERQRAAITRIKKQLLKLA